MLHIKTHNIIIISTLILVSTFTGITSVTDGNRAMTFDLSMITDPKDSRILLQLAIKTQTLPSLQSVRHIYLYQTCSTCGDSPDARPLLAQRTLQSKDSTNEWLELTIHCDSCNWKELDQVHCILQLTDDNNLPISFTEETATNFKSFLILFTHKTLFPLEEIQDALRKRRQTDDQRNGTERGSGTGMQPTPNLTNRPTLAEVRNSTSNCSKHEILLTPEELRFRGRVLLPIPGAIPFSYCLGECNELRVPTHNGTTYDSRTRAMIHHINRLLDKLPPPCCIPEGLIPIELILSNEVEESVYLESIPDISTCKCQH